VDTLVHVIMLSAVTFIVVSAFLLLSGMEIVKVLLVSAGVAIILLLFFCLIRMK